MWEFLIDTWQFPLFLSPRTFPFFLGKGISTCVNPAHPRIVWMLRLLGYPERIHTIPIFPQGLPMGNPAIFQRNKIISQGSPAIFQGKSPSLHAIHTDILRGKFLFHGVILGLFPTFPSVEIPLAGIFLLYQCFIPKPLELFLPFPFLPLLFSPFQQLFRHFQCQH